MKLRIKLWMVFLLFLVGSCEKEVKFRESQPIDAAELSQFDDSIRGRYQNHEKQESIEIKHQLIVETSSMSVKLERSSLDSIPNIELKNDSLWIKSNAEMIAYKIEEDSIIFNLPVQDTLFQIGAFSEVKKHEGVYFLNERRGDSGWNLTVLQKGKHHDLSIIKLMKSDTKEKMITSNFSTKEMLAFIDNFKNKEVQMFKKESGS